MHEMLPIHVGMRVRLLERFCLQRGLVKDAESAAVHVAIRPQDEAEAHKARRARRPAYLSHLPHGAWVRMDKHADALF